MVIRRTLLKNLAGLWAGSILSPAWAQSVEQVTAHGVRYGWDANVAGPIEATFHVATDGNDAADGSSAYPVRTIQRGVDLLATRVGGSLAIHGGLYREQVSLDALRGRTPGAYRIHRFGHDVVTITAAETLAEWAPCPAEEARAIGITGPDVFVARMPVNHILHGALHALNLHEAGNWRSIAVDRANSSNPEATGDQATYHFASFEVDEEDRILTVHDPRLQGIPTSWMQDVEVLVYHSPNMVGTFKIARFDPVDGVITLADPGPKLQRTGGQPAMLYALRGAPWALTSATWIPRRTGPNQVSIYFRPTDVGSLHADVEVSLRPTCIEIGKARHVELFGLNIVRAAGGDRNTGICIRRNGFDDDVDAGNGLTITHCRIGDTQSINERGYGALFLRDTRCLVFRNISIENVRGGFGLFLASCDDADLRFLHIVNVSNSPARFYTLRRAIVAFSLFEDSARDAHANKFNFYEGSDTVLVYAIRCRNVGGYATYQEASRINFAFCDLPCDPQSQNRALVSQNRAPGVGQGGADGSGSPLVDSTFYYWNNSLTPDSAQTQKANALQLGPESGFQKHAFFNNIMHGGGFSDVYTGRADPEREQRSDNRYTGLAYWQAAKYGWHLGQREEVMRINEQTRGAGRNMLPEIAYALAPLFPNFQDWDRDIDGKQVNWSVPPIGCRI